MSAPSALRATIAVVLIAAGVLFVIGTRVEKASHTGSERAAPAIAESGTEPAGHADTSTGTAAETFMGVNPDSTGAVAGGVVIALVLAAAVLFVRSRATLLVVAAAAVAIAALDVREATHQMHLIHGTLAALAWTIAALHGGAAVAAGAGFARSRTS